VDIIFGALERYPVKKTEKLDFSRKKITDKNRRKYHAEKHEEYFL